MGEMNEQVHHLLLEQRKTLSLGGVQDVKSFDENEVLLVTSIDSLVYTEHGPLQKKGSALARLFR